MQKQTAISYLTHRSWRTSRLGLERMRELMARLGNPQDGLKFIHIAGTNGKGSVSAMLSSILTESGYQTGLYTSPFINRFNERIQINGASISDEELEQTTVMVRQQAEQMEDHPTEFELITAVALCYFAQQNCDVVVLEVGLGGRLDATNIIPVPEVAVITPIGLDHTEELGDSLDQIAAEKAGIIKPQCSVVLYPQARTVERIIESTCIERASSLTPVQPIKLAVKSSTLSGHIFDYDGRKNLHLSLLGNYQPMNAATAITTITALIKKGWNISDEAIRNGLAKARWPARFEILHVAPYFIVDGGHNPQCVESILDSLNCYFPGQKLTFLWGVMADKDYVTMADLILPHADRIITVTPDNPRALPAKKLAEHLVAKGFVNVTPFSCVEEGVKLALNAAGKKEVICAFGSFYMAGAIRSCFGLN